MQNNEVSILKEKLKLNCTKQIQTKLKCFSEIFKIYNSHTNLISKNDEKFLFEKHIYDSLAFNLFIEKYGFENKHLKLLDIGAGGGFPSIPIAIFYKNISVYPLDSIAKKVGFIELAQKELMLENLFPICERVENLSPDNKGNFDIIVSRAVAPLNIIMEYALPYVKNGGFFIAYKAKNSSSEIEQANNALKILKSEIIDKINYELPLDENFVRELIVIKKHETVSSVYPRKASQIKRNPL